MPRYSIIHPSGVLHPAGALSAERWADLKPATSTGTKFVVSKPDGTELTFWADKHTEQVIRTLIERPLLSASRCRLSQYTSHLRELGVAIDTVGFRDHPTTGQRIYGMYELADKVNPIGGAE